MASKSSKEEWKKKRRQEYLATREEIFYIFCEGKQTEPLYFAGFKQLLDQSPIYRDMVLIEIEPCGEETLNVINHAKNHVKKNQIKNGQIWCVYDKDNFPAERFNAVPERINSLNKVNSEIQYHAAWSNECIEFWFLLHFSYYTSNNARPEYIKYLSKKFREFGLKKYVKNDPETFYILLNEGNPKMAIHYAKQILEENAGKAPSEIAPGTTVFRLVEELAKYLPEEEKNKFL